eukprot:SAG11_NODE_10524_length_824_cov_5.006897_1_plen_168_part_10
MLVGNTHWGYEWAQRSLHVDALSHHNRGTASICDFDFDAATPAASRPAASVTVHTAPSPPATSGAAAAEPVPPGLLLPAEKRQYDWLVRLALQPDPAEHAGRRHRRRRHRHALGSLATSPMVQPTTVDGSADEARLRELSRPRSAAAATAQAAAAADAFATSGRARRR